MNGNQLLYGNKSMFNSNATSKQLKLCGLFTDIFGDDIYDVWFDLDMSFHLFVNKSWPWLFGEQFLIYA